MNYRGLISNLSLLNLIYLEVEPSTSKKDWVLLSMVQVFNAVVNLVDSLNALLTHPIINIYIS